jgi:phage-related protein
MDIVYYHDPNLGYCPVKKYLSQYLGHKIIIIIDGKIRYVAENDGRPVPPISFPLVDFSFLNIHHRKDKNILIRICYFRHEDKMVLLHAFEKPDSYDTEREKRTINKEFMVAENYIKKFKLNVKLYEEYI